MIIRPFRALRPQPQLAARVASPPYDVVSSDEAREMVKSNPLSFLRINKPEVDFSADVQPGTSQVQQKGKENLERFVAEGTLFQDDTPCFYIYRLTWKGRSQTGIVVTSSVSEYDEGLIKKHEKTRPVKVNDRADHIQTVGAQVGPVFTTYKHDDKIRALVKQLSSSAPIYDFESPDNVRHEVWVVSDPAQVEALRKIFEPMPEMYIADGHHRSEAGSEVRRRCKEANPNHTGNEGYNFFLNVIFPDDELRILPYNRVVMGLNGQLADAFLKQVSEKGTVSKLSTAVVPERTGVIGIFCDNNWYRLELPADRKKGLAPADAIDSAILTVDILEPALGIGDIRTDDRIDFVGGIRGTAELEKLVRNGKYDVAFSLHEVTVGELLEVADAAQVMPPKSTWFEPKLRSGLIIHKLDD